MAHTTFKPNPQAGTKERLSSIEEFLRHVATREFILIGLIAGMISATGIALWFVTEYFPDIVNVAVSSALENQR